MRRIKFYRTGSGECPIELFLDSQSDQHARKVTWVLRLVERLDSISQQFLKKLAGSNDVWEIRVQISGVAYRFLVFFERGSRLIPKNAFAMKQQKTPYREIELAEQRRKDYRQGVSPPVGLHVLSFGLRSQLVRGTFLWGNLSALRL